VQTSKKKRSATVNVYEAMRGEGVCLQVHSSIFSSQVRCHLSDKFQAPVTEVGNGTGLSASRTEPGRSNIRQVRSLSAMKQCPTRATRTRCENVMVSELGLSVAFCGDRVEGPDIDPRCPQNADM
jgi:hypothetical protein